LNINFRPALADEVKVGFFNLDRACQTQQTDIIQLKEMTNVLQVLIKVSEVVLMYFIVYV